MTEFSLDFNSGTARRELATDTIIELLDRAREAEEGRKPTRDYLGGSFIGEDCSRRVQYQYQRAPSEPFKGQTLRIFDMGHMLEDAMARWFRTAGFILKTEKADGGQFGFSAAGGRFRGHADGVFVGWWSDMVPELEGLAAPIKFPALWENKALNKDTWNRLRQHGIKKTKPVYWAQVQLYMHYLHLDENPAVFTAVNKNDATIYIELIEFNPAVVQDLIDKAVRILEAAEREEIMPRIATSPDAFACRFCPFKDHCWK